MKRLLTIILFVFLLQPALFAQHDYEKALNLSTYFLGAQRCGNTQSWIHPSGGCHMTDGQPVGRDLTGGWHDCGDYLKFHVTGPYTALMYLYGYDKYPEAYSDDYSQAFSAPPSNGIADVLDEVKIETDYLIKCVNGSTIYWQVAGSEDHNSFSEPITNGTELLYSGGTSSIRPVYTATDGHSNAFGGSAAALALMSILYRPISSAYADSCEAAAITYYNIGQTNEAATADATGFYAWLGGADTDDEMGLGAIMLYRATGTASYLTDAQSYASGMSEWVTFNYGTLNHILFNELYEQTGSNSWLNMIGNRVNSYSTASCGYIHLTTWGSLRDASCAALLACLYHQHTGNATAYSFAKSNIDFILGSHSFISTDAPANFSFLIGYDELGGGYPQHPHHGAAFGKTSNAWTHYNNESVTPGSVPFAYELKGGLAGGPESSCSNFHDVINNFISSEYCTYYNAGFNSAVAYIHKVENTITAVNEESNDVFVQTITDSDVLISNDNSEFDKVVVTSADGKVLSTTQLSDGPQRIDLPGRGIFILKLVSDDHIQTVKVTKT